MRLQSSSDFVERKRVQGTYQSFASTTGANAYLNQTPNATGSYLDFIKGRKEQYSMSTGTTCVDCSGLPYQYLLTRSFRT